MTTPPLGRGDLIRSGPAFFLIDEIRPGRAALGYRLVRQTQLRTRNEYLLPPTMARSLGLPPRAAWLVRLRLIRIPIEANREHISAASPELLAELARQRTRVSSIAASEAASLPRIVSAMGAVALLALASCDALSGDVSPATFAHAQRIACAATYADIAHTLLTPAQRNALRTVCAALGLGVRTG